MARIYATAEQYETHTGGAPPANIDYRLARASAMLDAQVFRYCVYAVDDTGLPTDTVVAAAFADAVCAQAQWGVEVGDTVGAAGVGYGSARIGSVDLGRSVTAVSGADSPARQIAPAVWDALQAPDLTPDRIQLGMVAW
ncbi:hypothetical protein J7F03_20775 [Streptomyces sp. ISL-43]|uniref:hypothetical protein n=1 Tax=Streptomyces sp. ISL-43 TaxID=2819183 RepID=UPI001BE8F5E6|nr:hypothetical protein [Streptomyces sp. ISL-43]MBT2449478.1 hypothetical protein [Streptomyces sp. ISL-43]